MVENPQGSNINSLERNSPINAPESDARVARENAYHRFTIGLRIATPGVDGSEYAAFSDWVDRTSAYADYRGRRVQYALTSGLPPENSGEARVLFWRAATRLNSQYALDRSVVRMEKKKYEKTEKRIEKKSLKDPIYRSRMEGLRGHAESMYDLERRELEHGQVSDPEEIHALSDKVRLQIHAQAHKNMADRLGAIREGFRQDYT